MKILSLIQMHLIKETKVKRISFKKIFNLSVSYSSKWKIEMKTQIINGMLFEGIND